MGLTTRHSWLLLAVLCLAPLLCTSCGMRLFSKRHVPMLPDTDLERARGSRALAIAAPDFRALRPATTPVVVDPGSRMLVLPVLAPHHEEWRLAARTGERLGEVLRRLEVGIGRELELVAVHRREPGGGHSFLILCDVHRLRQYGDLAQDLQLTAGDVLFLPSDSHSLTQEFYAATGQLAAW